jgi:O-antigen ligase
VLAVALAYISISGQIPTFGVKSMGRDTTFTGRTDIWDGVRSVAWENPIQGVGYGAFWSKHHEFPNVGDVNEGHNGYLDTFVETGLIGLVLLLFVIVSYVRKANREKRDDDDWASFRIVFLLMVVVHNFTETSFLRCSEHFWALFILMYMTFPGSRRPIVAGETGEAVADVAEFREETTCSS